MSARRIYLAGGPGSGKTTLGRRLAEELGLPFHDLDGLALKRLAESADPEDAAGLVALLHDEVRLLAAESSWVAEGAFITWTRPFFEAAEAVVWLDTRWRSAGFRIVKRHVVAELRRDNRWPGWRRLLRFWLWCRRYHADSNPADVNEWGTAARRSGLKRFLEEFEGKLHVCRGDGDVERLIRRLRE